MKKHKKLFYSAFVLGCVGILSACGNTATQEQKTESKAKTHVNAGLYWTENTLDPATEYDGWSSSRAGITETLVTIDEKLELKPLLADSWKQENDTTWVFHIREGVTFHNGKKVDAQAVKAAFERAMTIQERAKTAAKIKELKADGQNLTIVTEEPFGALLANLTEPLYSVTDVKSDKDLLTNPIGTGPFMVTSFTPEKEIQVKRYDQYWNGASKIETIKFLTISDDTTRAIALQSGELDIAQRVNSNDLKTLKEKGEYNVFETPGTRIRTMIINHKNEQLADVNVRQALANAIDYNALVKVMGESFVLAGAPFPSTSPYAANQSSVQTYNLEKAKSYLEAAGYKDTNGNGTVDKDGKELQFRLAYDVSSLNGAIEAIQNMLAKVGVGVTIEFKESTADINKTRDFDLLVRSWQSLSTGDPQWMLENMFKTGADTNLASYSSAKLDETIGKLTVSFNLEDRIALTKEAQDIVLQDAANIFLFGQNNYVLSSKQLKNVKAYPIDYYFVDNKLSFE